jgi:triacylglycerol lipase
VGVVAIAEVVEFRSGGATPESVTARWVGRIAAALTAPLVDQARPQAVDRLGIGSPGRCEPLVEGHGLPVLLVGGLASTPETLAPLHDWLSRCNCRPVTSSTRYGLDCGERTAGRVTDALRDLADTSGRRCVVIAHSRGGQVARTVAVRHPDLVHGLITLGSPLNRLLAVHPLLRAEVAVLGLAGTLGVPGVLRGACLWGRCCRAFRADLLAPWPAGVSFLSLYSRRDRMVDWRSSLDPAARHRELDTTHSGLLFAPESLTALGDELRLLAQP